MTNNASSVGHLARFANLTGNNRDVFHWAMETLDSHARLPLFWDSAKSSAWYSTALLARGRPQDIGLALKYVENILTQQYTREGHVTYGTFKCSYLRLWANDDSLAKPEIYKTYDPNNALFVTIAFILMDAKFSDLIPPRLLARVRNAMYIATKGDEQRVAGVNGDNLRPCYTNPWFMRIVCAAYVGHMVHDDAMVARSQRYLDDALALFERHGTISEYNSPTYAGITLLALGVAHVLPDTSVVRAKAGRVVEAIWNDVGRTYNASLTNLSGAWDRTYGYDMTMYVSGLGAAIANVTGIKGKFPLPNPLAPSLHFDDAAAIPLMSLVAPYIEAFLPLSSKLAFTKVQAHSHIAEAISPPFDVRPRRYSYYVGKGYSVGGIEFDECLPGGPSLNLDCFAPGVVLWDTGSPHSPLGWISYVPTSACCSIRATSSSLRIMYSPSRDFPEAPRSDVIRLHISTFAKVQLHADSFSDQPSSVVDMPGMKVRLTANFAQAKKPELSYLDETIHGWYYYALEYSISSSTSCGENSPELIIDLEKVDVKDQEGLGSTEVSF